MLRNVCTLSLCEIEKPKKESVYWLCSDNYCCYSVIQGQDFVSLIHHFIDSSLYVIQHGMNQDFCLSNMTWLEFCLPPSMVWYG